eukprot:sb/3461749/
MAAVRLGLEACLTRIVSADINFPLRVKRCASQIMYILLDQESDTSHGDHTESDKPESDKPESDKPESDKPESDKPEVNPDPNESDLYKWTAEDILGRDGTPGQLKRIHRLCVENDIPQLMKLLERSKSLGITNELLLSKCDYNYKYTGENDKDEERQLGEVTPLHVAALHNHCGIVKVLLDAGSLKDVLIAVNNRGNTALHWACHHGRAEVVREIIATAANRGILPDVLLLGDKYQRTPLHRASLQGKNEVAKVIMSTLDSNQGLLRDVLLAKDESKNTPLHRASELNNTSVVEIILTAVKTKEALLREVLLAVTDRKQNPLHQPSRLGHTEVVKLILSAVADKPDLRREVLLADDMNTRGMLACAVQDGRTETMEVILLATAMDVELLRDMLLEGGKNESTVLLHRASQKGHTSVVSQVLSFELGYMLLAKLLFWKCNGMTPFGVGVSAGSSGCVELVLGTARKLMDCNQFVQYLCQVTLEDGTLCLDKCVEIGVGGMLDRLLVDLHKAAKLDEVNELKSWQSILKIVSPDVASKHFPRSLRRFLDASISIVRIKESCAESEKKFVKMDFTSLGVFESAKTFEKVPEDLRVNSFRKTFWFSGVWVGGKQSTLLQSGDTFLDHIANSAGTDDSENGGILVHPVLKQLIDIKWSQIGRLWFWLSLAVFLAFLGMLIVAVYPTAKIPDESPSFEWQEEFLRTNEVNNLEFILLVMAILRLIGEVFDFLFTVSVSNKRKSITVCDRLKVLPRNVLYYINNADNVTELILYISTVSFVGCSFTGNLWLKKVFAFIAVAFGLCNMFLILRYFPKIGIYFIMVYRILMTVMKIIPQMIFFLVSFKIMLAVAVNNGFMSESFFWVWVRFFTGLEYDDLDINSSERSFTLTMVLLVSFGILVNLILLNLVTVGPRFTGMLGGKGFRFCLVNRGARYIGVKYRYFVTFLHRG